MQLDGTQLLHGRFFPLIVLLRAAVHERGLLAPLQRCCYMFLSLYRTAQNDPN